MKEKSSDMRREAQKLADDWAPTFNRGRIADLTRFYGQDARAVPPGRSVLAGAQEICEFFAGVQAQGFRDYAVDLDDVLTKDTFLVASGRWALRGPAGRL